MNEQEREIDDLEIEVTAGPPPELPPGIPEDERYLMLLTRPLEVCAKYKPKFG